MRGFLVPFCLLLLGAAACTDRRAEADRAVAAYAAQMCSEGVQSACVGMVTMQHDERMRQQQNAATSQALSNFSQMLFQQQQNNRPKMPINCTTTHIGSIKDQRLPVISLASHSPVEKGVLAILNGIEQGYELSFGMFSRPKLIK